MDERHQSQQLHATAETDLLRALFQGKWRLKVLQEIVQGPVRLSQLTRAIPECRKKVLIDTLHGLENLGWIERKEYVSKLKRVDYSLTPHLEKEIRRAVSTVVREEKSPVSD